MSAPTLVLGFDTENDPQEQNPCGIPAVEKVLASLEVICGHLREYEAPATFFLVGKLVEAVPQEFRRMLADPRYEIASHTYSHITFKAFLDRPHTDVPTLVEVEHDVTRGLEALKQAFGLAAVQGICAPGNFYQGIQNRPDLQQMLVRRGLRHICSDGRGPADTIPAPFTQPYWYTEGSLLEVPHTGWHCNSLNSLMGCTTLWPPLPSTQLPLRKVETVTEQIEVYHRELAYALDNDLYYAPTMHPWSLYRFDPKMQVLRAMLQWTREHNMPVMTYGQVSDRYYRALRRKRA